MTNELSPFLPLALGLAVGVLVWAVLCSKERHLKEKRNLALGSVEKPRCKKCSVCGLNFFGGCDGPYHGHAWCRCKSS
jgi:hypothetical protein